MDTTRRIVLPGFGTPTTFTPEVDSVVTVFTSGNRITLKLRANERTRIEFLSGIQRDLLAA